MAVPSISTYTIGNGSHRYGSIGGAAVMTSPSDSVTKVSAIISQTSGGAAIETVETTVKTSSDQFADRWALSWPTTGITSSPYYVTMWATNADGDGPTREVAPYIYFPPTVAITAPANGSTLASASVTMAWTASDPYGISAQRVTVLHGADVLLDEAVGESDTSYAVPSSVAFLDGESYTFRVTARNGNGMEASADSTVAFSFDAPAAASVTITDDGATATIAVDDPHYTESGATIAVDGSAIADSFTVFGKSTQDGTPTPSAPVAIESVEGNLYDPSTAVAGYLNANGTIAAQTSNNEMTSDFIPVTEGEVITVTLATENHAVNQPWIAFEWFKSDQSFGGVFMRNIALVGMYWKRLVMPENAAYVRVSARHLASGKANVEVMRGYRWFGSETHDGIDVVSSGRNIADPSATFDYYIGYPSTAPYDTANVQNATALEKSLGFHPVSGGQSISLSVVGCTSDMTSTSNSGWLRYVMLGADLSLVEYGDRTERFRYSYTADSFKLNDPITVPSDARWFSISFRTYGGTPCIRLDGSNEYVPYEGDTYPIDLQGNSLRSLPDGTKDKLRVGERKVLIKRVGHATVTGNEGITWNIGGSSSLRIIFTDKSTWQTKFGELIANATSSTRGNIICNKLPANNAAYNTWTSASVQVWTDSTAAIMFGIEEDISSSAAFNTWLQSNPLEVLYPLAAPQEIDLGAVSDMPFIPEDGEMWVDGTTMEASLRPADYAGQPTIQSVDIARVNPDGTWTLAQGVAEGQSAVDPLPPLGVPYRYALTSHAAGGGTKVAYAEHTVETRAWHLNFGDAAQEHVSYLYNPQATMTLAQGGESYHFADGGAGRGLPVFYPTTDRDMSGTLRFDTVLYGDSDILLDLCDRYPVAWLRDPFGHRWRAHVRPSVSHGTGQVWPVTIAWDAVRFEEV